MRYIHILPIPLDDSDFDEEGFIRGGFHNWIFEQAELKNIMFDYIEGSKPASQLNKVIESIASTYSDISEVKHGSPEDRGSADRYYYRRYNPHWLCKDERIPKEDMTEEEIAQYKKGWGEEDERKDWE